VTTITEMQHKTVEGFCCSGRVEGVILQQESVVGNLLKRSFSAGLSMLRGVPTHTVFAHQPEHVAAQATKKCCAM
jgi:hypothetical protein